MPNWDHVYLIGAATLLCWSLGKQLSDLHKLLVDIRQALWDLKQR